MLQINQVMQPLVDELVEFWSKGATFSTPSFPDGRLYRGALIALVCDLPAAKKVGGVASHSATRFCSFCDLPRPQRACFDDSRWTRSDNKWHRDAAQLWEAADPRERERLLRVNGVRSSILLKLDYWDPTKMIIVDLMHNISGIVAGHCRYILGIDAKAVKERTKAAKAASAARRTQVDSEESSIESEGSGEVQDIEEEIRDEMEGLGNEAWGQAQAGFTVYQDPVVPSTAQQPLNSNGEQDDDDYLDLTFTDGEDGEDRESRVSAAELEGIRSGIVGMIIPSWVPRSVQVLSWSCSSLISFRNTDHRPILGQRVTANSSRVCGSLS